MALDAVDRAIGLMAVPLRDLPPLATAFRQHLAMKVGMCMETCITAYAVYAQCVEGLACDDPLYLARSEDHEWFRLKRVDDGSN